MDQRATAIHEAGHAVIDRVLWMLPPGSATIIADEDSAGHSITADPWLTYGLWQSRGKFRDMTSVFRARILTFMAGAEAEVLCLGSCAGGDGDDRYQIGMMLEEAIATRPGCAVTDEDCDRYEKRLRKAAGMLVRRHRQQIELVADALVAKGSLSAAEINDLIGFEPPPPSPEFGWLNGE